MTEEIKREYGSGSGTSFAYAIEIRGILPDPFEHPNGFLVTKDWRRIPIKINHCDLHSGDYHSGVVGNIPVRNFSSLSGGVEDHLNLLDFDAAYTLACMLQVQANVLRGQSVVCRLVEVEIKYSFSAKASKVTDEICLFEQRRSLKHTAIESLEGEKK
jgi:hypothetical protein